MVSIIWEASDALGLLKPNAGSFFEWYVTHSKEVSVRGLEASNSWKRDLLGKEEKSNCTPLVCFWLKTIKR